MSINVTVSGTSVGVSVSAGIGPAGFINAPGTNTSAFGTFQLVPGSGVTISTSAGQYQIASYDTTQVASFAPVQSVAGRTGAVVLQAADITAGTFAIGRIPTIGYTALSGVPTTFTPEAHTHSTTDVVGLTASFAAASHTHDASNISSGVLAIARIPTIGYTALSGVPTTFAPQTHTHSTSDVVALTAAIQTHGFQTVNGKTGATISLAPLDITAVTSSVSGVSGASQATNVMVLSQADYDVITAATSATTLYFIT